LKSLCYDARSEKHQIIYLGVYNSVLIILNFLWTWSRDWDCRECCP